MRVCVVERVHMQGVLFRQQPVQAGFVQCCSWCVVRGLRGSWTCRDARRGGGTSCCILSSAPPGLRYLTHHDHRPCLTQHRQRHQRQRVLQGGAFDSLAGQRICSSACPAAPAFHTHSVLVV